MDKIALSFSDQVKKLQGKGLIIENLNEAEKFLSDNNYYRLNYYFHKFLLDGDKFEPGTTFNKIKNIYENDRQLRYVYLPVLEQIEIKIKTRIANYLGLKYTKNALYLPGLFYNNRTFEGMKSNILDSKKVYIDPEVKNHHSNHYDSSYPVWVALEFFTFRATADMFGNLKRKIQNEISNDLFGFDQKTLLTWFRSLAILRNTCAHYNQLFLRNYPDGILIPEKFDIENNNSLFERTIAITCLIDLQMRVNLISKLKNLENENIDLSNYGFSKGWSQKYSTVESYLIEKKY